MDELEKNLPDDFWRKAFEEAAETPPPRVWNTIERRLDESDGPKVLPLWGTEIGLVAATYVGNRAGGCGSVAAGGLVDNPYATGNSSRYSTSVCCHKNRRLSNADHDGRFPACSVNKCYYGHNPISRVNESYTQAATTGSAAKSLPTEDQFSSHQRIGKCSRI